MTIGLDTLTKASRRLAAIGAIALAIALPMTTNGWSEEVKIGIARVASGGAVFVAIEKGYFEEQGIEPTLTFFEAAQPIAVAAASGDIDFGSTALTAGFYSMAGQGVLRIIGAQSHERAGYQSNAVIASKSAHEEGLKSFDGLRGKSVGINAVGSSTHYSLGVIADKYKIDLDAIRAVPLQTFPNQVSALRGGQVDAIVVPSTIAKPLLDKGEAVLLGYVGDETPWQIGAIFTSTDTAENRRDVVERFLAAYKKGAQTFHDAFSGPDGEKSVEGKDAEEILAILAKYTGQPIDLLRDIIPYMDPEARLNVADIKNQIDWYKAHGLLSASIDPSGIVDQSYVVELPSH